MRWCVATSSAQAISSPAVQRSMSAASRLSTSDQLMAPAFFTDSPDDPVCMKSTPTRGSDGSWGIGPRFYWNVPLLPWLGCMKRLVVVSVGVAALAVGVLLSWYAVRQEREFERLIAAGDAALAQDQTFVAIEAFSGALALKRDSMLAHLKRGDTYRRRGELDAALRDLRDAAALDPSAPKPVELLGDVNVAMRRYERAAEHYRAFTALDDRVPRVFYKLALTHYRNGQAASAIEPLRRAVAIEERFTEAHYLLGMCLRDRKQNDEALRALTRALEINPAFAAAREEMADLYAELGRNREAI